MHVPSMHTVDFPGQIKELQEARVKPKVSLNAFGDNNELLDAESTRRGERGKSFFGERRREDLIKGFLCHLVDTHGVQWAHNLVFEYKQV